MLKPHPSAKITLVVVKRLSICSVCLFDGPYVARDLCGDLHRVNTSKMHDCTITCSSLFVMTRMLKGGRGTPAFPAKGGDTANGH